MKILLLLLGMLPGFSFAENLCDLGQALDSKSLQYQSQEGHRPLWELQWKDEFDVPGKLNPALWKFEIGGSGWGNKEEQYYTDRLENARVENGHLVIEARKEDFGNKHYTSARINSVNKMTYG